MFNWASWFWHLSRSLARNREESRGAFAIRERNSQNGYLSCNMKTLLGAADTILRRASDFVQI